VLVRDLVAQEARDRAADARSTAPTDLPSGRTQYRTLADYESEMKTLAQANPTLVKLITLPNKTWGGKDVMGIEITENVTGQRRQAGVREHGRPPRPRVAGGRAYDGVGL
jgi:hypothetical protein